MNKNWHRQIVQCHQGIPPIYEYSVYRAASQSKELDEAPHFCAHFDFILNLFPYSIKMNGMGKPRVATAAKIDIAGPTPSLSNIGFAASGIPVARRLRRNVFAEVADAA
jgi:hypothetical protein